LPKDLQGADQASRLLIVEEEERDYTGGQAVKIYKELRKRAVVLLSDQVKDFLSKEGDKFCC